VDSKESLSRTDGAARIHGGLKGGTGQNHDGVFFCDAVRNVNLWSFLPWRAWARLVSFRMPAHLSSFTTNTAGGMNRSAIFLLS